LGILSFSCAERNIVPICGGQRLGLLAEDMARVFLEACGYQCLVQRYRKPAGEIDLVVRRESLVVFVEVKARRSIRCGSPEAAVTWGKRRRLRQVARHFLQDWDHGSPVEFRFDVVAVEFEGEGKGCRLRHLSGVF
jgi:putative endonuclease